VSLAQGVPAALRATGAWRGRLPAVQEAFTRARQAQLLEAPERLFKGKVEKARKGDAVTITYDFKRADQLEDFAVDVAVDQASALRLQDEALLVKGKVGHVARFKGGELAVKVEAATSSSRQPNLNVILGDRGGWTGALVGLGFAYGPLSDLRVDPAAPGKRGGFTVPLPAHVCIVLGGRAPRLDGTNWAVETQPGLTGIAGKAQKLEALRGGDGSLKLRHRSKNVFQLPAAVPGWDEVGGVALAPFASELSVDDLELTGVLDPTWLADRARTVAAAEAAALAR
jgi:hypothetical protein